MIEEGREWDVHVKTKVHKRLENLDKHEEMIRIKREEARLRREMKGEEIATSAGVLDGAMHNLS